MMIRTSRFCEVFFLLVWGTSAFLPSGHKLAFLSVDTQRSLLTPPRQQQQEKQQVVLASATSEASPDVVVNRLEEESAVLVDIPVPGPATKAAYDKVCREVSKSVQIPGFRKGSKIPGQVLEQAMAAKGGKNAIKIQAINELVGQLVEPTLAQFEIEPIGQAALQTPQEELAESYVPGQPFVLPVRCDVWPSITWKTAADGGDKPYLGLEGSYTRKPFDQEKLDKAISDLQERYATTEPISSSDGYQLQMGDACTVNMNGFMATADGEKGEPLPNAASGDAVPVVLGTGRYMEGLVEGIVGATVGETRTVSVNFPDKLRDKTLAGKTAIFDVEVLEASKRSVPEITDEFANKVKAGLTAEALIDELKKAIEQEESKDFMPERNKVLGEALAKVMEVQVPDTLVTNQAREKFAMMMADMRSNGVSDAEIKNQINPENFAKYKDIVKDDIIRDFKISMATDEIARLEGIGVQDYQVEEQMEAIRKDAAESGEDFDEKMIRARVEATLVRQAVMDWLADNSNLKAEYKEEEGFNEELMQQLADQSVKLQEDLAVQEAQTTEAVVDAEIIEDVVEEVVTPEPVEEVAEEPAVVEAVVEEVVAEEATEEVAAEEPAAIPVEEPVALKDVVEDKPEPENETKQEKKEESLQDMAFNMLSNLGIFGNDK